MSVFDVLSVITWGLFALYSLGVLLSFSCLAWVSRSDGKVSLLAYIVFDVLLACGGVTTSTFASSPFVRSFGGLQGILISVIAILVSWGFTIITMMAVSLVRRSFELRSKS